MKQEHIDTGLIMCLAVNKRHFDRSYIERCVNSCNQQHGFSYNNPTNFTYLSTHLFPNFIKSISVDVGFDKNHGKEHEVILYSLTLSGQWFLYTQLTLKIYSLFLSVDKNDHYWAYHYKIENYIRDNLETMDIEKKMKTEYINTNNPNDILSVIHPSNKNYNY